MTGFNRQHRSPSRGDAIQAGAGSLRRLVVLAAASATVALLATPIAATAAGLDASPPTDCNGNAGVLATPQDLGPGGTPFLTKALTNTVQGTGSTTYFYLVTTNRPTPPAGELLDCAYSTITGNPIIATYGSQQNDPTFSGGQLTISLTVNKNDSICDRVQYKGFTDSTRTTTLFTDHSNLVGAPAGTSCSPVPQVPEAPLAGLLLVTAGLSAAWFVHHRRRRRPLEPL